MGGLIAPAPGLVPDTAPDDPRVGHLLGRGLAAGERAAAALVGFPSDEGVRRNGGRPGAAQGPPALRRALYRLTPGLEPALAELLERTRDLGDVPVTGDLERDQAALAATVAPLLDAGTFVVVLGGGHEAAYGHFLGYAQSASAGDGRRATLVNWDAHADVRPTHDGLGHSGSPFRQALEHPSGAAARYVVAGLQPASVARGHLDYVRAHGRAELAESVTPTLVKEIYAVLEGPALVSFDLDAVAGAHAPGVSAPAVTGLAPELWLEAARRAGACPAVVSADVVELSPPHDDGRTARLAALTVWELLRGRASATG